MYIVGIISLMILGISVSVYQSLFQKKSAGYLVLLAILIAFYSYQTSVAQTFLCPIDFMTKGNTLFLLFVIGGGLFFSSLFRYGFGSVILLLLGGVASIGNALKVESRGEVVLINDFKIGLVQDVIKTIVFTTRLSLISVGIVMLFLLLVSFLFFKVDTTVLSLKKRGLLLGVGMVLVLGTFTYGEKLVAFFHEPMDHLNIADNLELYGPGGYFLVSSTQGIMKQPDNYSKETMRKVVFDIEKNYRMNEIKTKDSSERPTLIFILSEAFSDPTQVKGTQWSTDPMPTIRKYMEMNGGKMLSSVFGGGTSNTEFSILSGFSYDFLQPTSYVYNELLLSNQKMPFLSSYQSLGYQSIAIHSHLATGYGRNKLFSDWGFDAYLTREDMEETGYYSEGYISDATFFNTIKEQVENSQYPLFIHGISMQNHFPYTEKYKGVLTKEENLLQNKDVIPSGNQLALYARGIQETDAQVREFTKYLTTMDKPVTVVFYGDHFPALDTVLYESVGLKQVINSSTAMYEMPYFIWSNHSSAKEKDAPVLVNPEFLGNSALKQAGVPRVPFFRFLEELSDEIPAFRSREDLYFNPSGQKQDTSPLQKERLERYRLIQYDLLVGKQYSKQLFHLKN